ncbi:putative UvrD-like Helicase [Cocos nucifera]|nr:putative UvrD-like Helicase [Cocos nucifera]
MGPVLVSDDFKRSFVGLQNSLTKQIIIGLLWRLACGWRPKRKSLYFSKFVKQFRVHGLSLICTTDIIKESSKYIQVMKVWNVLTLTEVSKLHQRLEHMMSSFNDCYVKCCMIEKIEGLEASGDIASKGKDSEGIMLMKFYALSTGVVKHLLTATDGQQIELPFELSDLEAEVVTFPDSAFVVGRSGTGKTLVLVTKLIQRQQHFFLALQGLSRQEVQLSSTSHGSEEGTSDAVPHGNALHQIFLTMNPILCSAVKTCISQLRRYAAGVEAPQRLKLIEAHGVSENLSRFSEIPNSFTEISESHFPLVISLHKFLIMLDGSMKNSFFDKFSDVKAITGGKRTMMSHVLCQLITIKEIDYDRFVSSYWPCFDKNLTRKLEPLLVFSEIIYCIKGGMGTGNTSIYKSMDKEEYTSLSENRHSSASIDKRKMIYKIFMSYEKQKEEFGEYDISDLVNDLHFRFSIGVYEGCKMDYLYIDEVQDFTMKQICLFKHLCVNFQSGLMFSGDTAQALVNDFRFEDIKNLFYKEFLLGLGSVPKVFLLSTNFRTHAGILKLAESILDLLHYFFPLLVKQLVSEKSREHGEAPVLLEAANETDVLDTIFGTNETIDHIPFQFGAEQVILVRDKHAKEKVVSRIGNKALVLTIKDCKGLEFQDVLLFNFFEESPLKKWSVVYEFMDNQEVANPCLPKYPHFDQDKHQILFTELKQLYVAVTRTKRRLWIYESSRGFGGPIFNYWKMLGLVQVERLDSSFVRRMEVYCKIEEWDSRGMKFFNDGNYEMAIVCFKRSGDIYMENWSKAALLQADGRSKLHVNSQLALDSLSKAADIYESIGKMELAASCFMESHKYTKAGMIYLHKFHEPRFEDAGDCFALAGSWSEAAKVYAQGQCLSKCLSACHQGLQFDMGFQFLREWHAMVPGDVWIDYLKDTISDYHKLQDIDSLEKFVRAFPADALGLLLQSDHYEEASVVANLKGDIMLEADILRIAKHYEHSANLVLFYAIGKMLWTDGNKGWPLKCFNELEQVLGKARFLCLSVSNDFKTYVSAEADFLSDQSASLSSFARHINSGKTSRNICVETFAARKYLDICLRTNASEYYQESDVDLWRYRGCSLQDMFSYASIQSLMFSWNSWVKKVKGVLSYFHSIGTPEVSKYTKYEKFCMKFFGVLKTDIEGVYISSNARAAWIQWKDERHLRILDNVAYMSDLVFNCLAERYWASELISVGASLLQKLQELHSHLSRHIFSVVQQGLAAHYFYMVRNCLKEHGFPGLECESATFYESLTKFDAFLFRTFFPLDFSRILEQIELSTQGTNTSLITAVLHRNLGVLDQFGAAKIGRVAVFLLSRKLSYTLHRTIRGMIGREFPWQHLLRELSYSITEGCHQTTPLAITFPSSDLDLQSQLLLLESILFYASSCQIGRGWFITSKSSLSAFLNAKESRAYFQALSVSSIHSLEYAYKNTTPFYDFILDTSSQLFSLSKLRWAAIKGLSTQSLVLKMVILVGLICLNSAKHFLKVREMLNKVAGILSILPQQFLIRFWNSRKGQIMSLKLFGSVLSRSMESMGDQVVVVHMDDYSESFDHLRPLYLKQGDLKQGEEYAQALLLGINKV